MLSHNSLTGGAFYFKENLELLKIKSLVPDFVATTTFKQGIGQTIEHFQRTPELRTVDAKFDQWCDRVVVTVQK